MITEEQKEICTGFNHRWGFIAKPQWARTSPRGWSDHYMTCDGCSSMRRVSVNKSTGEKRIRYWYVDGYSEWKGSRRDFAVSWVWRFEKRHAS